MSINEKDKLKALLKYWIGHNQEHSQEFQEWAEKAMEMGEGEIADEIKLAVEAMDKAGEILARSLKRLGEE